MNKGTRWGRKRFFSSYTVLHAVRASKMIMSALSNGVTVTVRAVRDPGAPHGGTDDPTLICAMAEIVGLDLQSKRH